MEIEVKRSDCRFYVDEAHRKVVCVIPDTKNLVINYIDKIGIDNPLYYDWKVEDKLRMPHSFSGVATCHEDDVFDVETGKLIAYNKARNKLNTSFFKRANYFVNYLDSQLNLIMEDFNHYGARLSTNAAHRENKINKILGEKK